MGGAGRPQGHGVLQRNRGRALNYRRGGFETRPYIGQTIANACTVCHREPFGSIRIDSAWRSPREIVQERGDCYVASAPRNGLRERRGLEFSTPLVVSLSNHERLPESVRWAQHAVPLRCRRQAPAARATHLSSQHAPLRERSIPPVISRPAGPKQSPRSAHRSRGVQLNAPANLLFMLSSCILVLT
jgi:hypothetical protein